MKNRLYESKDEQLFSEIRKLKEGSSGDYNAVYELSNKYLYKIVNDIVKNQDDTEDILQEAYLQIYNKINTLNEVESFYVWAGRIATNMTYRYIQKNRKELLLSGDEEENEFFFDNVENDNEAFIPETVIENKESQRLIAGIINSLSTEQKLCIQYYYYEEMSVNEIAEAMGCSTGTVKSRLNYARKSIKDAVLSLEVNEGTKLYSLAAFPVFALIFRQELSGWLLKAADLVMPFFTSGGVYHAATAAAGGAAIAGGSIGGGAQIAGGSIGGGAQVAGGSIGGSAAVTSSAEAAGVSAAAETATAGATAATETATAGGTGAAAATTTAAVTATGLSKGAIAGIIIAATVVTGGTVNGIAAISYHVISQQEASTAYDPDFDHHAHEYSEDDEYSDAEYPEEVDYFESESQIAVDNSTMIDENEQMGASEPDIQERLAALKEKDEQIYTVLNDYIESYEEMKESFWICLSNAQYGAVDEYSIGFANIESTMRDTEILVELMKMEPNSPEMQTLYDEYVKWLRGCIEYHYNATTFLKLPLCSQYITQYMSDDDILGEYDVVEDIRYFNDNEDATYDDLWSPAREADASYWYVYQTCWRDVNQALQNPEVQRIVNEYATINSLKEDAFEHFRIYQLGE